MDRYQHYGNARTSSKEGSFPNVQALTSIDELITAVPPTESMNSYPNKLLLLDDGSLQDDKSIFVNAASGLQSSNPSTIHRHRDSFQAPNIGGSNGSMDKPTLILYPRKSVLSGSLRDLAQVRSSIISIPEGTLLSNSALVKSSRDSTSGSRASLMIRPLNRGITGSTGYMASDIRRSALQVSVDGIGSVSRPVPVISEFPTAELDEQSHTQNSQTKHFQHLLRDQMSLEKLHQERRSRPVSLVSLKNLNKFKESLVNISAMPHVEQSPIQGPPQVPGQSQINNDYYEWLAPISLVAKLGKGAFGKVKEGICSETLQRIAVKIIGRKRLKKAQNGLENTIREIKMLRRLNHPNVVTLVDVFSKVEDQVGNIGIFPWFTTIEEEPIVWLYEDGKEEEKSVKVLKWYLVFEFCACSLQTLLDQCEDHKLSIAQSHWYFVQLMEGLSYLHSQSIVHRDIKPGNMLITVDGKLKISDFGVAEQLEMYDGSPMKSEVFAGTHQFLSPEIADGVDDFDAVKVDIWACGVTLYNMVSGRLPFEFDADGNLLELYERIMAGVFEMPSEAGPNLIDLFHGMLNKDPIKRFTVLQIQSSIWMQSYFPSSGKSLYLPTYHHNLSDTPTSTIFTDTDLGNTSNSSTTKSVDQEYRNERSEYENDQLATAESKPDAYLTPCETTMIPFLSIMFQDEIEDDLQESGTVFDQMVEDVVCHTDDLLCCTFIFGMYTAIVSH
ncbi:hypothetical protein BASA62_001374 [Batrachochytrium salamandrivorans]|nr:hypothetical protein BASA62_001374 [Batrachochytrium salamandrivorans]